MASSPKKRKFKVHAWVNKTVAYDVIVLAEDVGEAEELAGQAVEHWDMDKIQKASSTINDWGLGSVKEIKDG